MVTYIKFEREKGNLYLKVYQTGVLVSSTKMGENEVPYPFSLNKRISATEITINTKK